MQIGILGTTSGEQSILLQKALEARGAYVHIAHPKKLTSWLPRGGTRTNSAAGLDLRLEDLQALVVRYLPGGSLEQVIYRLNVLHRLERLGLKVINSADALEKTVDKYYATALLADAGLPVPRTVVTERYDDAMQAVQDWGRVVIKPVFGSLGQGIVQVDGVDVAHRVLRALEMGRYLYYVQEYLPHDGVDYRLFVVNGSVIGAMRRRAEGWRTNIARGGQAEPYQPSASFCELALQTAAVLGADYLGVDILLSQDRAYVLEANGIPGWLGLQTVVKQDIADVLAAYIMEESAK
jgi:ribosomal protein S6--L-glutamate ligase/tetrahydromethanopterin:alpha-L-glutamate ligase